MLHRERRLTSRERILTPRETNVIRLLCAGNRNEEICKKLHIEYNSLVNYLVNLRKKLGVSKIDETHPAVRRVKLAIAYWKSNGLRVPDKPHKIEGLTDEEAKVAYMVATGKTNQEIIDTFEDTKTYPKNFLHDTLFGNKYNVTTICAKRVAAARWYWDRYSYKESADDCCEN